MVTEKFLGPQHKAVIKAFIITLNKLKIINIIEGGIEGIMEGGSLRGDILHILYSFPCL